MRIQLRILRSIVLLVISLQAVCAWAVPDVSQQADEIVSTYRKIIVLTSDSGNTDATTREQVSIIGRMLFQQNEDHLAALGSSLSTDPVRLNQFLDRLEKNSDYHDADKLVFRDLLEDLSSTQSGAIKQRISEDLVALGKIQDLYQKELSRVFEQFQTRGMPVRREAWEKYLEFLRQKYQRDQLLKEYQSSLPPVDSRGTGAKKKNRDEIFGTELPPKTLLLTFDDGPHPRYTDKILETLKKYDIQAIFFEVGRNLGTVNGDTVKLTPTSAASYRILQSGSVLGNHSYTHALLPKLDEKGYSNEINSTNQLLKYILKSDPVLFRPPYGARNDSILQLVKSENLKTMEWNIDSMDWADPVPNSVAQRVLKEIDHQGRGIILFHDIHNRAVEVLPSLIETLQKNGYRFASWNGSGFSVRDTRGIQTVSLPKATEPPYRESWAAVIGVDSYQKWPKLRYAAHDATAVHDLLVQKYKFKPDHVFLLLNEQATRENILSLLGDKLANPEMVKKDDRVFVFFAGHGATRKLPSGRDLGYIIPVEADLSSYQGQAISMTNFQDIAEAIPAKHLLFVMDSCYSGLALTRGGGISRSANYLQEIARRGARQMFTAGGADEQVADNGPNGHSVFTWTLLQGLDGRADLNGDGVITASELATYVAPAVSALSHQTPAFGNLAGSEGGDFIFELRHESEFLNADSPQLGDDAIRMNAEVEQLRAKNKELEEQVAEMQAKLRQQGSNWAQPSAADPAASLNDEGMRLYKEKKYEDAFGKFSQAATLDSSSALFANNAGFALYKLERYEDSIRWFKKTLSLDPNRAVAYINLGDAYVKLNKNTEAKEMYEQYLKLAPASRSAPSVKEKLQSLGGGAPGQ
jgi:peptidoglycan/xylan/chitin deacetylase (PgdA/CDA1 family)/uncharacterized caspase-like protein